MIRRKYMKNSTVLKSILSISGLVVIGVGGTILLMPVAFYAVANDVDLRGQVNLLNEIRAGGGGLLVLGILILSGAFVKKLTFSSIVISIGLYFSYGIARILSMMLDGKPSGGIVVTTVAEILIGLLGVFTLVKYREPEADKRLL
jgi:hypothetical protein